MKNRDRPKNCNLKINLKKLNRLLQFELKKINN